MNRGARLIARLALGVCLAGAAGAAAAEELPSWPHEQQAMLRQVEDELLTVQRQMFKARQQGNAAALETSGAQFRDLQDKRRQLIELTRDQLPSQ